MIAASAARARLANSLVARRAFSTTRAQLASPYHYAEGPRSNIPFNPKTKYFFFRYWAFMSMCAIEVLSGAAALKLICIGCVSF